MVGGAFSTFMSKYMTECKKGWPRSINGSLLCNNNFFYTNMIIIEEL
jgi:hypothetical protein